MALLETISEAMKAAMKQGDKLRLETLRTIRAGLLEKQVERRPGGGMTAEDELAVLAQASKKRKEAIDIYRKNNRPELADQEEKELRIIEEFLPRQLTVEEVRAVVESIVRATGAATPGDFGKVMSQVMKELKGKADGKLVQESVKQILGA